MTVTRFHIRVVPEYAAVMMAAALAWLGCDRDLTAPRTEAPRFSHLSGVGSAVESFTFVVIDVPCSSCPGGIARQTIANGINPAGDIVGTYRDNANQQHGFLLSRGRFTTIDVPGALATVPTGISAAGHVVGRYTAPVGSSVDCAVSGSPACIHGFLHRRDGHGRGAFSTITFPGHPGAFAQRITADGEIYGCLHDFDLMGSMFGAVWAHSGHVSLTADGGELADVTRAVPASMNNGATRHGKTIVGHFTDMMTNRTHGFVVKNGDFQAYDVPGSTFTQIWDVNPRHEFVGTYVDNAGTRHGFVQVPDGSAPSVLDFPGAAATIAFGVNPAGVVVGQYTASGQTHGFVAVPAGGRKSHVRP